MKAKSVSVWYERSLMLNLKKGMIGSNVLIIVDGLILHAVSGPFFMCVLIANLMAILITINVM